MSMKTYSTKRKTKNTSRLNSLGITFKCSYYDVMNNLSTRNDFIKECEETSIDQTVARWGIRDEEVEMTKFIALTHINDGKTYSDYLQDLDEMVSKGISINKLKEKYPMIPKSIINDTYNNYDKLKSTIEEYRKVQY